MSVKRVSLLAALFLLLSVTVGSAQVNGSFESGLATWNVVPAGNAFVTAVPRVGFPSDGNLYVGLTSSGTGPTVAGYGPFLGGLGAGNAAVLSKTFVRPAGVRCEVQVDWELVHSETPLGSFNDFVTIDIIDVATGVAVANMLFCDNGLSAGTPFYTGVPGAAAGEIAYVDSTVIGGSNFQPAPVGVKRALVDLSFVPVGTSLRLDIAIANGGDSAALSTLYVDNFRVLNGGTNDGTGSLRVLGAASYDGVLTSADSAGDVDLAGPIDFRVMPGQRLAIRATSTFADRGWALLSGNVLNDGSDFGFDDFNLSVAGGISIIVDGLNPTTPLDVILGTLATEGTFIEGSLPTDVPDGDVGLIAVVEDPTNFPLFIEATATTRLEIRSTGLIPEGDTQVLDSGGAPLSLDDFGAVDLTPLGGGFDFYGTTYTQCFVGSNGYVTFGAGDSDFTESAAEMYTDLPRIAPMWHDFNPGATTEVIIESSATADAVTISWIGLPELTGGTLGNRFSLQLFGDGTIVAYYDSLTVQGGLVGITPGGLTAPPVLTSTIDFSSSSTHDGGFLSFPASVPIFQYFGTNGLVGTGAVDRNDIMTLGANGPSRITYVPRDVGGYRVFCGVR